jgi:enoyl-CoA hydratase
MLQAKWTALFLAMIYPESFMLNIETNASVTKLTLANPSKGNALSRDLIEALIEQTTIALSNVNIHTIELHAEGSHFCTGLDLSNLDNESDGDLLHRLVRIETFLALLWSAPITTKAFAKGRTWGAGADIFVACEHRLLQPNTTFRFPGAQFGISLGTARLTDRIGTDKARQLILHSEEMTADTAIHAGLANAYVADHVQQSLRVSAQAAAAIRSASRGAHMARADSDLAALVRSAATPGLKQRIVQYRDSLKKKQQE